MIAGNNESGSLSGGLKTVKEAQAQVVRTAIVFELSLGLVAIALASGCQLPWSPTLAPLGVATLRSFAAGAAGALPLLAAFALLNRWPTPGVRVIRDWLVGVLHESFAQATTLQLAYVAMAAGLGEELLFRGWLQRYLTLRCAGHPHASLLATGATAILFGGMHSLSRTYFALATLASLYLSWLYVATDSLWAPITAHACYDWIVLVYFRWLATNT